jgi:OOP family OmpA-OmpF porin
MQSVGEEIAMWHMMSVLTAILVISGFAAAPAGAFETPAGPHKGRPYISAGAVFHQSALDSARADLEIGPGVILGYGLTDHFAAEMLYSRVEQGFRIAGEKVNGDTDLLWFNLLYQFGSGGAWRPFVLAGAGRTDTGFTNSDDFDDTQFNFGVGVFRSLNERWSLRADVRGVTSDEGDDDLAPFVFVGLSGVVGQIAKAPPPDTDGDGVPDAADQCPDTPFGREVGADGCQLDSDADGVVDAEDQCPGTPAGVAVDARGCPLDSDGDGVADYKDECPDSEPGARVDEKGCYIELAETVTIDLNLEFDTDSVDLRAEHYSEIERVVQFLRQYPTATAVVEGHTDSDGSEAYNQALSERRAESVRVYLVEQAGVSADRLTSVGYGESRPVAGNDSPEGKQANRRVSAVVAGTQTVRQ